jgi:hypothetical protein
MAKLISVSVCLTDIDKNKITVGKNGKKYLNVTVSLNDEKDNYGNDVSLYHSQSKEEREAKAKRSYLGNGKVVWSSDGVTSAPASTAAPATAPVQGEVDDLPF